MGVSEHVSGDINGRLIICSAKLDAHYIRSKVRSATWIQKHLNPNFTCIKEGEVLSMSDVEDTIYAYDESVLVRTVFNFSGR